MSARACPEEASIGCAHLSALCGEPDFWLEQGPGDIPEALKAFPELQHDPNNPEEIQAQLDVLQVMHSLPMDG